MANSTPVNLVECSDARVWADEFCRIFAELHPGVNVDRDLMVSWFANAIMRGYDDAMSKANNPSVLSVWTYTAEDIEAAKSGVVVRG